MESKITVLHLGIKFWPYNDQVISNSSLVGIRGGGMTKYCANLIPALPSNVLNIIICQRLDGQRKVERNDNVVVYRISTFGNRAIRQIITNSISFILASRIIYQRKIDIIHGHMVIGIFFAYLLNKLFKKSVIGTPYSFTTVELNAFFNRIARYIEKRIYKKVDAIVFESVENKLKAEKFMHVKFLNSIVIHTGISYSSELSSNNMVHIINVLFLGRLVNVKAIDNLILSLNYLSKFEREMLHINIVGEGELFNFLQNLIEKHDLSNYITLHGFVRELKDIFSQNDLFILPSHQEGLSIALLEAMSNGLACIVSNFGVPFKKGVVFEMDNNSPETIAEAFKFFIWNRTEIEKYKVAARNEIKESFSLQSFGRNYYELYSSLIENEFKS